jgi:AraC-like DNA-binding protein
METYAPSINLQSYVKIFHIIESDYAVENFILPDTAIVMAIRFKGIVSSKENGIESSLPSAVLSGLRHTPRLIKYSPKSGNVLVVFHPGGPAAFLREPLHELSGLSVPLNSFKNFADMNDLAERLSDAESNVERIKIVEEVLVSKLKGNIIDPLVLHAARQIKSDQGTTRIKELIAELSISRDAFEKRFRQIIGTSPKQFSNITRIRSLIDSANDHKTLTELAYCYGYFDQSHFIKDFKIFTGQAPSHFFKSSRFW